MRIARFSTSTVMSSWTNLAMADTLRSMGHEVLEGTFPVNGGGVVLHQLGPILFKQTVLSMPTMEQLESCDVILVSGPEYLEAWLLMLYGKEGWFKLKGCKVAFYFESTQREDFYFHYESFVPWFDLHFFPDPRDAERFRGHHIQACVDTAMFRPCELHIGEDCDGTCEARRQAEKKYEAAFVGQLYNKRVLFISKLMPLMPEVNFRAGAVSARDLEGERPREWTEMLARNMRQMKIHVALPSANTTIMTSRQTETMACGTFLLTYRTSDTQYRDGEHCRMYDAEKPEQIAELVRYYLAHEDEREAIARAGLEEVRRNHSLKTRLTEVLELVGRA